jgi:pimeloyl-ACP methyl ester carboxylesterase
MMKHLSKLFIFGSCLLLMACSSPPKPINDPESVEKFRLSKSVEASNTWQVSYLQSGDPTGSVVIFIHGTPGSARAWTDFVAQPNPHTQVIAIDRPGYGKTSPNQEEIHLAEQAKIVAAFFPKDGRKVILIGHSLGGPIAAKVAAEYPNQVGTLILLAAAMDPGLEKNHPLQYVGNWFWVKPLLPKKILHANLELMGLKEELIQLEGDLSKITSNVIVVQGDQDDLVPVANVPYIQKHITNAKSFKLYIMENQNHFLPWNAQDKINAVINEARGFQN